MADELTDSMRARLDAELRSDAGQDAPTIAEGGLFSLGHVFVAALLGAGFGGIILVVRNDRRTGAARPWRGPAWFVGLLLLGVFLGPLAFPYDLRTALTPFLAPALHVLGPVAIAWNLQGDAILERPRVARAHEGLLLAIGLGWLCAAALWVPLNLALRA